MGERILTHEQKIQELEHGIESYQAQVKTLESLNETRHQQIDSLEETIQKQGDVIRTHLTEMEPIKKELEELKSKLGLNREYGPIGRSHEEKPDIIFHQQNNPSKAAPSHLACGKKIDEENVAVFEREKVTCKVCLSKSDPHIRY